jgi:putative restriction endonuclease
MRNGLVLFKKFQTLFDLGYVGIDPDYRVHVSPRLYEVWHNGRRYYEYDNRLLVQLRGDASERPSQAALEWHLGKVFLD